jgi:hypothetical protein
MSRANVEHLARTHGRWARGLEGHVGSSAARRSGIGCSAVRLSLPVVVALAALPLAACGSTTTATSAPASASGPQSQPRVYPEKAREAYLKAYKQNRLEKQGACILREAERTLSYAQFRYELEHERAGSKLKAIIAVCLAEGLVVREGVGAPKTIQPTVPEEPNP